MKRLVQRILILCFILIAILYSQNQNDMEITVGVISDDSYINQQIIDVENKVESLDRKIDLQQVNKEYFTHTLMIFTVIVTILVGIASFIGGYLLPLGTRKYYNKQIKSLEKRYKNMFINLSFESFRMNVSFSNTRANDGRYLTSYLFLLRSLEVLYGNALNKYLTFTKMEKYFKSNIKGVMSLVVSTASKIKKSDFKKDSTEEIDEINQIFVDVIKNVVNDDFRKKIRQSHNIITNIYYK